MFKVNDEDVEDDHDDDDDDLQDIGLSSLSTQRNKLRKSRSESYKFKDTHIKKLIYDEGGNDGNPIQETSVQSADITDFNDSLIASMPWIESVLSNRPSSALPATEGVTQTNIHVLRSQSYLEAFHDISDFQYDEFDGKVGKTSEDSIRNSFSLTSGIQYDEYLLTPIRESDV